MGKKSQSIAKISKEKIAQFFKEYDRLSPKERLERFDKNVVKAEKKTQIKKEEIQKKYKAKMKEWGEVEKYREKCIRPEPEFKSIYNFCVSLFNFIKGLDFKVWALLWREKRNDIADGFNGLDKVDVTRCPTVGGYEKWREYL